MIKRMKHSIKEFSRVDVTYCIYCIYAFLFFDPLQLCNSVFNLTKFFNKILKSEMTRRH